MVSLDEAARAAGLSRTHFSTYFKRKTGLGFREWQRRARLKVATALIESNPWRPLSDLPREFAFL